MVRLRKLCNVDANSLLESVVALSIISVCLYIAIMIYTSVFTPKTSARFYSSQNKINEVFFVMQLKQDSLLEKYNTEEWNIEEEMMGNVKKITIKYKDSLQAYPEKSFYIPVHE